MASKYNPYNDYQKIVGYKGNWFNAKYAGQDPKQYAQAAMPYYQSLVSNGYEQLADELSQSDYNQAQKLLEKYSLKPDAEYELDAAYNNLTGKAQDIINAPHPNDSSIDKLMSYGTGESGMAQGAFNTAQGIATGATPIQPSAATQGLLDAYQNDQDRLNGQIRYDRDGNVISGLNTSHYNTGRNQLDYYNNFDITKQPYYQGIMDAFNLGGYNAAQGAYANGAANNGGNIDSYAAANANRQQLAFTTAGMQQAMAMAQQNAANWNNLYSQMSNDLFNQGSLSLDTLKVAKDMYAKDADERMNALDVERSLASDQIAKSAELVGKMIDERMEDKNISYEMAVKEADIAKELDKLEQEIARDLEQSRIEADWRKHESDNTLTGTLDTNAKNLEGDKYIADSDLAATKIQSDADIATTARKAAADEYAALMSYNSDVYRSDNDFARYLAQYQNELDRIDRQSWYDQELAKMQNQANFDLATMDNQAKLRLEKLKQQNSTTTNPDGQQYLDFNDAVSGVYGVLTAKSPEEFAELSGVTDWESLKMFMYNAIKDWKKAEDQVEKWKKDYPNLINDYLEKLRAWTGRSALTSGDNTTQQSIAAPYKGVTHGGGGGKF